MKYMLCALLLSTVRIPVRAQDIVPAATAFPYRYAALVVEDRYFSGHNRLNLDYGQGVKDGSTSVIDALNYLARHGWELVSVTNVPREASGTTARYIDSETRYLHRRRIAKL